MLFGASGGATPLEGKPCLYNSCMVARHLTDLVVFKAPTARHVKIEYYKIIIANLLNSFANPMQHSVHRLSHKAVLILAYLVGCNHEQGVACSRNNR